MSERAVGTGPAGLWYRQAVYLLTWADFDQAIEAIADRVRLSRSRATCILGVARGGLVPAVALSNVLGIPDFHAIAVERNAGDGQYLDKLPPKTRWGGDLGALRGERVLIVDDVAGSGETLRYVRECVLAAGAAEVSTAVVARMQRGASEADFAAIELDDWVVFPWESADLAPGVRTRRVTMPAVDTGK